MEHDAFSREKIADTEVHGNDVERFETGRRGGIAYLMHGVVDGRTGDDVIGIEEHADHVHAECTRTIELFLTDEMLTLILAGGIGDVPLDVMKNESVGIP